MSNKYIGSWKESKCEKIDLEYNKGNLIILLSSKVKKKFQYTDQQICNWCDSYFMYLTMSDVEEDTIYNIVYDIAVQYEMFLDNSFSLVQLQELDFSKVKLPDSWYEDWLNQLDIDAI